MSTKTTVDPVGVSEIADRLGVKRGTVDAWRVRLETFPPRKWTVGGRPAWDWTDIAVWATETGRGYQELLPDGAGAVRYNDRGDAVPVWVRGDG